MKAVARRIYDADTVTFDAKARKKIEQLEAEGYGHLPVCIAKTQSSFSTDPTMRGALPAGTPSTCVRCARPPVPGSSSC